MYNNIYAFNCYPSKIDLQFQFLFTVTELYPDLLSCSQDFKDAIATYPDLSNVRQVLLDWHLKHFCVSDKLQLLYLYRLEDLKLLLQKTLVTGQ